MESKIRFKVWKMVLGIVALCTFSSLPANAQWFNDTEDDSPFSAYVEADLVSRYMWRGLDKGGISIQPAVGISLWDFSFLATVNVGFDKEDEEELNLTLGFEKFGFNIGDKNKTWKDYKNNAYDWTLKSSNISANVGIGATILSKLQLKVNYNIALGKTGEIEVKDGTNAAWDVITGKAKANAWQVSASYFF